MAHPGVIRRNNILDAAYEITGAGWIRDREPDQTSTGTSDAMVAYVVRHKTNITLLGLFVARDIDALWDLVDEFCDPSDYEYRSVENGALVLPRNELELDFSKRAAEVELSTCRVQHRDERRLARRRFRGGILASIRHCR